MSSRRIKYLHTRFDGRTRSWSFSVERYERKQFQIDRVVKEKNGYFNVYKYGARHLVRRAYINIDRLGWARGVAWRGAGSKSKSFEIR